jgi:outer membrane receptor for ferric coprogen and ferric-rhodotorulic acid
MVSYDFHKQNKISLNVNNLFNKKYISQVEGSDYDAGAPRSAMVTYTYKF